MRNLHKLEHSVKCVLVVWQVTSRVHVVGEVTAVSSNVLQHFLTLQVLPFQEGLIVMRQVRGHGVDVFTRVKANLTGQCQWCGQTVTQRGRDGLVSKVEQAPTHQVLFVNVGNQTSGLEVFVNLVSHILSPASTFQ
ncbi:hypothetical protein D3C72_777090 [compost metagenome]